MGLFSQVGAAKVVGGGVYMSDQATGEIFEGRYKVKMKAMKTITSSVGGKVFAIHEFEILESNNPKRKPGQNVSQLIPMNPGDVMGPVNVRACMCALLGMAGDLTEAEVEATASDLLGRVLTFEHLCEYAYSDENPFADEVLGLDIVTVITKGSRKPFPKHVWFHIPNA